VSGREEFYHVFYLTCRLCRWAYFTTRTQGSYGCSIGDAYFGSVVYADDVLLLSVSINGLQLMMNACSTYGDEQCIQFNSSKSVCTKFGNKWSSETMVMTLKSYCLQWVGIVKYLSVVFLPGPSLSVDCNVIKRTFYPACNSKFYSCKHTDELIKVQLMKSHWLIVLVLWNCRCIKWMN